MHKLSTFWQFCRPHTIIGSLISVVTLYLLTIQHVTPVGQYSYLLLLTIIASIACNIAIVGLNQIIDVPLDVINKPNLPLAAGTMQRGTAVIIVSICAAVAIVVGFVASSYLGWLIVIIGIIGYLYSAPPVRLKQHHLPAALCITVVRGLLVNIGMYVHFRHCVYGTAIMQPLPSYLWSLILFVVAFSIAIAWFKDLPDTAGDEQYNIKTFALLYNKKIALLSGTAIVAAAYSYCIYWAYSNDVTFLFIAHCILLVLFIGNCATIKLNLPSSITRFYMRFWVLFFAEYIVYAVWALL